MAAEQRLKDLGIHLPQVAKPVAAYVPAVRAGNLVFIAGQLPFVNGQLETTGLVGKDVDQKRAYELAHTAGINVLAALRAELGSLDKVRRVVRVDGFVACTHSFHDHPKVVNGASELFRDVFGEAGQHARVSVGVESLPLNAPVEVAAIFEAV